MAKKIDWKFERFVGNCWLDGKDVVAYKHGDEVKLVVETVGQKRIGQSKIVSAGEFDGLMDKWTAGGSIYPQDAKITKAALEFMAE